MATANAYLQRVCAILESMFTWSGLGFYKALGDPHRAYSFLNNTTAEVQVLVVQSWDRNSKVIYHKGSHLQKLSAEPSPNGFLEIPSKNLERDSIEHVEVEMKHGGLYVTSLHHRNPML